jgi:hypothetical protein
MAEREFEVHVKSLVTGEAVRFKMEATATVKATWDKAYEELKEQPRQGETFRCANGTDLTDRLDVTLEQLRQESICPGDHFEIRGPSGGAEANA